MDRDLWDQMRAAFSQISMPLSAHQQIQGIMQQIDAEAAKRDKLKEEAERAAAIPVRDTKHAK